MKNISSDSPERRFENIIADLQRKIEDLKTNQLSVFIVPKLNADPSSPIDGQMWQNTTSDELKIRIDGVTKVVTVT